MSREKILIVEDESIIAGYLEDLLSGSGYHISSIHPSGEEALKEIPENPPDLVLMDIKLKGKMDGIETASQIWKKHKIPIIYLTALMDEETLNRSREAHPYGYLVKPINHKSLHPAIEMALHKHREDLELIESEQKYKHLVEERQIELTLRFLPDGRVEVPGKTPAMINHDKLRKITDGGIEKMTIREILDEVQYIAEPDTPMPEISHLPCEAFSQMPSPTEESLKPVYRTKTASDMSGVESNLIRTYERMGLISPYRDPDNNYRMFTMDEIQWIGRIKKLIHQAGINIAGIKRILTIQPCWEIMNCPEETARACPVGNKLHHPCWHIRGKNDKNKGNSCYKCRFYTHSRRHPKLDL